MTEFNFVVAIERYGIDVILVAFLVVVFVAVLRRVLPEKFSHAPLFHLIPLLLGVAFFTAYYAISHRFAIDNWQYCLERGLAVSFMTTAESALISNLFGKTSLTGNAALVRELIVRAVEEKTDEAAKKIAESVSTEFSEEDENRVDEILAEYNPTLTEGERRTLSKLIVFTLKNAS